MGCKSVCRPWAKKRGKDAKRLLSICWACRLQHSGSTPTLFGAISAIRFCQRRRGRPKSWRSRGKVVRAGWARARKSTHWIYARPRKFWNCTAPTRCFAMGCQNVCRHWRTRMAMALDSDWAIALDSDWARANIFSTGVSLKTKKITYCIACRVHFHSQPACGLSFEMVYKHTFLLTNQHAHQMTTPNVGSYMFCFTNRKEAGKYHNGEPRKPFRGGSL